jgi:hypothetical protein
MNISHKTQAVIQFIIPTAIIYTLFGVYLINKNFPSWIQFKDNSIAFAIVCLASMLFQDLIPKSLKEILVFWKFSDRLPGHHAFSEIAANDSEIDEKNINDFEELRLSDGRTQQITFYRLYDQLRDISSVSHYSQRYIGWRDLTSFLAVLSLISLPVALTFNQPTAMTAGLTLTATTSILYLMTSFAARGSATALTKLVLQLHSNRNATNG